MRHIHRFILFLLLSLGAAPLPAQSLAPISPLEQSLISDYLHLLGSEHGDRRNGIEGLCRHPAAREEVWKICKSPYWSLAKESAIEILGCWGDRRDLGLLDSMLRDTKARNDIGAVGMALGRHGSTGSTMVLLARSSHDDSDIAEAAILGLGECRNDAAVRPTLERILSYGEKGRRWAAIVAIGRLGAAQSKAVLQTQLQKERDSEIRNRIQSELKTIKAMENMHYHYGGYMERVGDELRNIDAAGEAVIQSYHRFEGKPELVEGRRITLLSEVQTARVGDTIRIFHVYEDQRPEAELYVMGPKAIHGLCIDGKCVEPAGALGDYPEVGVYDGRVIEQPGWDYNFEISKLVFDKEGEHTMEWITCGLVSNVVRVWVGGRKNE